MEVPNSEGCTEVGDEKQDEVVDPGKAYDAASRSENIETEETEFKSIANDILNEDLDCEDGSNDTTLSSCHRHLKLSQTLFSYLRLSQVISDSVVISDTVK